MPKYINADEMLKEESEAYMSAQANIADIETYVLNHLVHAKIIRLLHDAPRRRCAGGQARQMEVLRRLRCDSMQCV